MLELSEREQAWEHGLPGYLQRDLDAYKEGRANGSTRFIPGIHIELQRLVASRDYSSFLLDLKTRVRLWGMRRRVGSAEKRFGTCIEEVGR